ncbi:PROTEIN putative-RELATED [Salix viminalis]|uniref:PROTEIN putative-RELATED n=1 Tax=Salix viminalis TaxID=40686 RepID=A0A9Q0V3W5_SALVM|nr:PROTEIN putative-RELATED [Salix viminalis]
MTARNYVQQDQQTTPNSTHAIFTFIMPVLLCFLQLMYQGKDYSPFDTHPITMWIALTCVLAYCVIYGVEKSCTKLFSVSSLRLRSSWWRDAVWFAISSFFSLYTISRLYAANPISSVHLVFIMGITIQPQFGKPWRWNLQNMGLSGKHQLMLVGSYGTLRIKDTDFPFDTICTRAHRYIRRRIFKIFGQKTLDMSRVPRSLNPWLLLEQKTFSSVHACQESVKGG